jgi:hypothetical protein
MPVSSQKPDVDALFRPALNEPDVDVARKGDVAWSVFEETPMPTTSDEDWRRTSLKRVKWNKMKPAAAP